MIRDLREAGIIELAPEWVSTKWKCSQEGKKEEPSAKEVIQMIMDGEISNEEAEVHFERISKERSKPIISRIPETHRKS